MDHPLRSDEYRELRKRVVAFLKEGFSIIRQSNIVFVCGGNEPNCMRKQFQQAFTTLLPEHEFFEPEFAMNNYFSLGDNVPFDIAEFEEIVGELSHSIVLFPEGPGSYAELGYFSAQQSLAEKTLLVIDAEFQTGDSFVSLGPAKKIHERSKFQPNIQFSYAEPNFGIISTRLNRRAPLNKNKKSFTIKKFSETSPFELFALIHQLVSILGIATIEDIEFFLRSVFEGHISQSTVKKITSILVGSKRLFSIGEFGHLKPDTSKPSFLNIKDGAKTTNDVLMIDISTCLMSDESGFRAIWEG